MIGAVSLYNRGGSLLSAILVFAAGAVLGTVSIVKGAGQWEEPKFLVVIKMPLLYESHDFKLINYKFLYENGEYIVIENKLEIGRSASPLIAWNLFMESQDMAMRRRIGAGLEKKGLNKWTGLLKGQSGKEDKISEQTMVTR